MNITHVACKKENRSVARSAEAYAMVALSLADGFIACWDEKYRSLLIRPETYINLYIDENWMPLLQTPPFPEYSSGHSVVSAASAQVLGYFLGGSFGFTDTSEMYFGLPARSFHSFEEAAAEAAISRLYGGIHYRDACDQGLIQGKAVAQIALHRLFGERQP